MWLAIAAILGIGLYALIWEPQWIRLAHYDVSLPGLDPVFDGFTILHLSDLHGRVGAFSYLRRHPVSTDIIVVTGDLYAWKTLPRSRVAAELEQLRAPSGVYYVSGNHDYDKRRLEVGPWEPHDRNLDNRTVSVARGQARLWIAGIPDLIEGDPHLPGVVHALEASPDPAILLSHRPDALLLPESSRFGLILSGHTHGGQITLAGWWAPLRHNHIGHGYVSGCMSGNDGKTTLITSAGLGASELPARFGARPEIVHITLHCGH